MKASVKTIAVFCFFALLASGCTGWNLWDFTQHKPYTYLKGDQFGRDQLANRTLVAYTKKITLTGKDSNEVLTLLGQPQNIHTIQRGFSEDWYFVYYKTHVAYNPVDKLPVPYPGKNSQGEYVVRFENDKVVDVISLN